tara:strand:- start:2419 stop:2631 length:213 start_codon:yes stop_codon:yes gene_type:complete
MISSANAVLVLPDEKSKSKTLSIIAHELPFGSETTYDIVFVAVSKNDVTIGFISTSNMKNIYEKWNINQV